MLEKGKKKVSLNILEKISTATAISVPVILSLSRKNMTENCFPLLMLVLHGEERNSGRALAVIRTWLGYTKATFATKLNCSGSYIGKLEKNQKDIGSLSVDFVERIADLAGIRIGAIQLLVRGQSYDKWSEELLQKAKDSFIEGMSLPASDNQDESK